VAARVFGLPVRRSLNAIALAGCLAALLPASAGARTGACLVSGGGPQCTVWSGVVTAVDDADTIDVDVAGDRRGPIRVRITGIQAMEQRVYASDPSRRRGDCHALEATARLEQLLRAARNHVRLAAQDPRSRSKQRWRRSIAVRSGGRWRDVGRVLIAEGHALWLPNNVEWAWNDSYSLLAERAADAGLNLWDPDACGAGPDPDANLRVWVNWDADGRDDRNVNGEWITVKNLDPLADVPLGGWWLRDSFLRRFTFPRSAVVAAGGEVTLFAGFGNPTRTDFYWGQRYPAFENATHDARAMGDGAYLFDPQGDLRQWMTYPCRDDCRDPNEGAIELRGRPRRPEEVVLRNVSGFSVDLEGYRLETLPYGYAFGPDSIVEPGETLTVEIGPSQDEDSRLLKHWYQPDFILDDAGDAVRLESFDDISLACDAWGSKSC
jgi:endonuclease YncB( thermonuclease family)